MAKFAHGEVVFLPHADEAFPIGRIVSLPEDENDTYEVIDFIYGSRWLAHDDEMESAPSVLRYAYEAVERADEHLTKCVNYERRKRK